MKGAMVMDPLNRKIQHVKRRGRKKPLSQEIHSMYRLLSVTLLILALGSTGAYLYINSTKSANGYTLNQLQSSYQELQAEQRELDHQIVNAKSILNIQDYAQTQ